MSLDPKFRDYAIHHKLALFPLPAGRKTPFPGFYWKRDSSKDPAQWGDGLKNIPTAILRSIV